MDLPTSSAPSKRVVALVMPDLLCEIATGLTLRSMPEARSGRSSDRAPRKPLRRQRQPPLGVLFDRECVGADSGSAEQTPRTRANQEDRTLAAVNETAHHYGVRPGQTVAEACALLSHLSIAEVSRDAVRLCLGRIAEVALGFGTTASIEEPDTVWVDITGVAHLMKGEMNLASELVGKIRMMGHVVRAAVSEGPRISQALARWKSPASGEDTVWVIASDKGGEALAPLPLLALPVSPEHATWFVRLGVLTIGELGKLPRTATVSRLGEQAPAVLDLVAGKDRTPLVAFEPANHPVETVSWEEPAEGAEPLLFALRGLVSRLSARLEGRGEAVSALDLIVYHDRSIAALRATKPKTVLHFDLAAPIWRSEELWRVISAKLQRSRFAAPTVGLDLKAEAITRALKLQLNLSRGTAGIGSDRSQGPEIIPVLLAELAADIGWERIGTLVLKNRHKPENKSQLEPIASAVPTPRQRVGRRRQEAAIPRIADLDPALAPTRLLPRAIPIDTALRRGASLTLGHRLYSIEHVEFERRLDCVEWWTQQGASRDYLRLWLQGGQSGLEVLVYVDRKTGDRFLQSICD